MAHVYPQIMVDSGRSVYTGADAVLKGILEIEDGVHCLAGCPMTPFGGVFSALAADLGALQDGGMITTICATPGEAVARVHGAQLAGCRGVAILGAGQLSDAASVVRALVRAGTSTNGGAVLVVGDDPTGASGTDPTDPRRLAESLGLPILEVGHAGEVKDWLPHAMGLSGQMRTPVGLLMNRAVASGGRVMEAKLNQWPLMTADQRKQLDPSRDLSPSLDRWVPLTVSSRSQQFDDRRRLQSLIQSVRRLDLNQMQARPGKDQREPLGLITTGQCHVEVMQVMERLGLAGRMPVLRFGMVWPLDLSFLRKLAEDCNRLLLFEERGPFVERQVRAALDRWRVEEQGGIKSELIAAADYLRSPVGGRSIQPADILAALQDGIASSAGPVVEADAFTKTMLTSEPVTAEGMASGVWVEEPRERTPMLCGGCPHRDSSSVLLDLQADLTRPDYMQRVHNQGPVRLIVHGDQGCSSLLRFPPTRELLHTDGATGTGGHLAAGAGGLITNRQLVLLGDASFYREGYHAIQEAVREGQPGVFLILANGTAALSGQHAHPGIDSPLTGATPPAQIERYLKHLSPKGSETGFRVHRFDPESRESYRTLLEKSILSNDIVVLIAEKDCGILRQRTQRRARQAEIDTKGFVGRQEFTAVATEVCEHCLACTQRTGCPGLTIEPTVYGPKIQTDRTTCINDQACVRLHVCPSFEQITVHRSQPPVERGREALDMPMTAATTPVHAAQGEWRGVLAGIGGQGVKILMDLISAAGMEMGYHVAYRLDRGRAVRTDAVLAQLVFTHADRAETTSATLTPGEADTVLGLDMLETQRWLSRIPAHVKPRATRHAVVNVSPHPTASQLLGEAAWQDGQVAADALGGLFANGQFHAAGLDEVCVDYFQTARSANIVLLGYAFEKGLLPVNEDAVRRAMRRVLGPSVDAMMKAFYLGRNLAIQPGLFSEKQERTKQSAGRFLQYQTRVLRLRRGDAVARQYRVRVRRTLHALRGMKEAERHFATLIQAAYDCVMWGGVDYLKRYLQHVRRVVQVDRKREGYALTAVVIRELARVMLIKDESFVAELLTRPEKLRGDRRKYGVVKSRGDRLEYRHQHRPEIFVFGRRWRFRWRSRLWQLRLVARSSFMRDLLPGWHRREREFRDWYENLVKQAAGDDLVDTALYDRWMKVLSVTQNVTGFREIIYPKMRAAQAEVDALLNQSIVVDAKRFLAESNGTEEAAEPETMADLGKD